MNKYSICLIIVNRNNDNDDDDDDNNEARPLEKASWIPDFLGHLAS